MEPTNLGSQLGSRVQAPQDLSQGESWYQWIKEGFRGFIDWLLDWSFAAKIAWMVFFLLALVVLLFWGLLWNSDNVPWRESLVAERYAAISLVAIIPILVYHLVDLWMRNVDSHQPDIRVAWNRGLLDLKNAGIPVEATPIYLVVGSGGNTLEKRLMEDLDQTFLVQPDSADNRPIHWYASRNAIYILCTDCCWTGAIAERLQTHRLELTSAGSLEAADVVARASWMESLNREEFPERPLAPSARKGPSSGQGTIEWGDVGSRHIPMEQFQEDGTIDLDDMGTLPGEFSASAEVDSFPARGSSGGSKTSKKDLSAKLMLTAEESAQQLSRLRYVCQQIQAVRDPLCPINGILVMTPFQILKQTSQEVEQFHRAVRADVLTIQHSLMLKVPVISLIYGLEQVRGFQELIRRIGAGGAAMRRFGKGFDLRAPTTVTELQNYCLHLSGVFEDWIYTLFCDKGALTHPGNAKLYELLSMMRTQLKTKISNVISLGFGHDPHRDKEEDMVIFGGCYFAATGTRSDQKAFFKAVFTKLESLQEELEWTPAALRRQSRFSILLFLSGALIVTLLVLLAAMIYFQQN